ncbi:MAG: serine/threonine-protein phosphatase [Planctomycetota bacterium]|nr:MAG: serine/threonine-protein phosphatase [Planctomycetota bacterium]
MSTSRQSRAAFWSTIPRRGRVLFFGAVFCTFAPGMVLPMALGDSPAFAGVLTALVCSGLIGMFWAMAFTYHIGWIAAALGMQLATFTGFGGLLPGWAWPRVVGFDWVGMVSMALVATGYGLFIAFISTEGRRSLRERTELALAQQIHARLVPPIEVRAHGYEVFGRSMPSTEVGGDLVDLVVDDDAMDVYLGDVTGHGVRSGVVMAMTKSAIHTARRAGADMGGVLAQVNDVVEDLTDPEIFVTFAALRVSPGGVLRYAMAGHLPILWWRAGEGAVTRLENEALPLGVMAGESFPSREARCAAGDLLVVLTDGLIEVSGADGRQLGVDGFAGLVERHAALPLAEMFERLVEDVAAIGRVDDDRTLLLIRVLDGEG